MLKSVTKKGLEEQKQNVKKELGQKMRNYNSDLEKFYAKWKGTKLPEDFNFLNETPAFKLI